MTVVGGTALLGVVTTASAASADTSTPQIVMIDPAANLSSLVRSEQRKGNEVEQTFRSVGKGFVARLDQADIARLDRNPDVLLIEPDRPVRAIASPGMPVPDFTGVTAPANDAFASATTLSGATGTTTFNSGGASRESGEPAHGATSGAASVWFTWTAPASGSLRVTTAGSGYDTLLAAYTGSALGSLTQLAANDDANGGTTSSITFNVTAGTTYRFAADGWGGQAGAGMLNWTLTEQSAPANDAFAAAANITGDSGTGSGNTTLASRETGEPSHGDASSTASVWYRWTAPNDGQLTVSTQGSGFDTLLGVYSGSAVNGLTTLAQNDDADVGGVVWSQVQVAVTAGTTYAIAVDGWGGRRGGVSLMWNMAAARTPAPTPTPSPSQPSAPGSGAPQDRPAPSWGQDRIDQTALPLNGRIAAPLDGAGVSAYIIDTGVLGDHDEFGSRVQAGYDAVSGTDGTSDCNGHGTHVAGTVAGTTFGVAPAAAIVPVRVLDCSGSGSTSGVIAGINWVTANHQAGVPAVANMSLGGSYSPALNAAVRSAVADGITFAVAAGNSNADACDASPASEPAAVTVGATTSTDARASYSNFGSCLDIFAPGSGILSASSASTSGSRALSGTSMASPHVAGAAALLLSGSPSATPQAVTTALTQGATANVVNDVVGSPNRLLNISSGVAPAPPASTPTPAPGTTPAPGGGGTSPGPGTPTRPVTPPTNRRPGRVGQRDVLAAPRLISVTRSTGRITVRITKAAGATGYQVFVNNRMAGRITGTRGTVKTTAARGAKVRVRAVSPTSTSVMSNSVSS
jgi:subtilisin family serine protease